MNWRKCFTDRYVAKKYVQWGMWLGDADSYYYMGKCVGYDRMKRKAKLWEQEYMRRGYLPIHPRDFERAGGYGVDISGFVFQKGKDNDKATEDE